MKAPEVDDCPCCEAKVVSMHQTSEYMDPQTMTHVASYNRLPCLENVEPMCRAIQDGYGGWYESTLFWRCRLCGCEWEHGSIKDTETQEQG